MAGEYRYEIKYAVPRADEHSVRAWVNGHAVGFRRAFENRQVNNIYFDSPDFQCLQVGLAGLAERLKLRARWYGPTTSPPQIVLECKRKHGSLGTKTSVPCEGPFRFSGATHRQVWRQISSCDLGPLQVNVRLFCVPILFNHYQRQYYVTGDGRVRLTIDSRLRFYDQLEYARFNHRFARPVEDVIVIELKADRSQEELVTRIADGFTFRSTAFSKFSVGLLGIAHSV